MHRVVVMGTGKVSQKALTALVGDLWDSISGDKRLIVPVLPGRMLAESVGRITEWARSSGVPYEVYAVEYEDPDALRVHEVPDPVAAVVASLSVNDLLLLAWDDDDKDCYRALSLASKAGITTKDLTSGLMTLEFDEDEEDPVTITVPIVGGPQEPDEEEDLPVTMPLRDDDLLTHLTAWIDARVSEAVAKALKDLEPPAPRARSRKRPEASNA